jgi:flavin-dependent dehydrogenase
VQGLPRHTDVLVVGGGPSGLAVALAARQKGMQVLVVDPSRPPIDKVCGEGLMPDGIEAIQDLGIDISRVSGFPLGGIRFLDSDSRVEATFPNGRGIGARRKALHQVMADCAAQAGVDLQWGRRATALEFDGACVDGQTVLARWIVGADGAHSQVRRWAGLEGYHLDFRRFGFRRHYRVEPWTDRVEVYWAGGLQIYVTPVGSADVCVALISQRPDLRLDYALSFFPELSARLKSGEITSREKGAVSTSRVLTEVYRHHVALVGDASGAVDAITGKGLCLTFRQASGLVKAFLADDLACYQREHRRVLRRPLLMTALILSLDYSAVFRRRVLQVLAAQPSLFARMLANHVGTESTPEFLRRGVVPLAYRLLRSSVS